MSICETCKNSFSDRDEIHCKAINGCRVDGLDFTHCKYYDEEQGPGFSVQLSGGTVWRPDMIQKRKAPPNAEKLKGEDEYHMTVAFVYMFRVHKNHKFENSDSYDCQHCPLCTEVICAYQTMRTMIDEAGIKLEGITCNEHTEHMG